MRNSRARWWTRHSRPARASSTPLRCIEAPKAHSPQRSRPSPRRGRCDEDLGEIAGRGPRTVRAAAGGVRRPRRHRAGAQPRALARAPRLARGRARRGPARLLGTCHQDAEVQFREDAAIIAALERAGTIRADQNGRGEDGPHYSAKRSATSAVKPLQIVLEPSRGPACSRRAEGLLRRPMVGRAGPRRATVDRRR